MIRRIQSFGPVSLEEGIDSLAFHHTSLVCGPTPRRLHQPWYHFRLMTGYINLTNDGKAIAKKLELELILKARRDRKKIEIAADLLMRCAASSESWTANKGNGVWDRVQVRSSGPKS